MFQINDNTIICICFLTDSLKKFVGSVFAALCCFFVYESTAQIQCPSNNIVIESKQSVKGNYRTKANIECAGKVADVVKLMAGEEATLKAGFTSPPHLNLELNNEGCNFYTDDWTLVNLDDDKLRKVYLPKTYPNAGVQIGRDTWFFSAYRPDDQVNFNFEIGPGNPYVPSILKEPLPLTHKKYVNRQFIYSTFENGKLNGVFYYGDSDFDIRDTEGVYLHLTDTEFEEILFVDYNRSEQEEVITVLESISPCVTTQKATIIYTGPLFIDGCEYIITINDEDYKAVNQEVIDDAFFENIRESVSVTLTYRIVPGLVRPCFVPTYFKQLFIVEIDYLN